MHYLHLQSHPPFFLFHRYLYRSSFPAPVTVVASNATPTFEPAPLRSSIDPFVRSQARPRNFTLHSPRPPTPLYVLPFLRRLRGGRSSAVLVGLLSLFSLGRAPCGRRIGSLPTCSKWANFDTAPVFSAAVRDWRSCPRRRCAPAGCSCREEGIRVSGQPRASKHQPGVQA